MVFQRGAGSKSLLKASKTAPQSEFPERIEKRQKERGEGGSGDGEMKRERSAAIIASQVERDEKIWWLERVGGRDCSLLEW